MSRILVCSLVLASAASAAVVSAPRVHPQSASGATIPVTIVNQDTGSSERVDRDEVYDFNGSVQGWNSFGTGLQNDYERLSGERPTGDVIIGRARDGDAHGRRALDNYISRLGRALAVVVNLMDPDVIVLGGGMSNTDEIYERVRPVTLEYAFTDTFTTPIRKALHGDSSGVRGAAWLWPDDA